MLSLKRSKKLIHIVIKDYVIRIIETNGHSLSTTKLFEDRAIPSGLIKNGKIKDEIEFYVFMRELVKELGLKNRLTRFIVPNALVIMRHIDIPADLTEKKAIIEYIDMEIGNSIHLPFQDPVFDITYLQPEQTTMGQGNTETQQLTLFAAPGEEMRKYTEIFADASLKPIAADVGMLGDYRYFHHMHHVQKEHVYLLVEFNMTSVYLGIFQGHQLEFLRYQDLDVEMKNHQRDVETKQSTWEYTEGEEVIQELIEEQVNELENIMNFYRFSLNKEEKMVTDIVVLGDYPSLHMIYNKIVRQYELPTVLLKGHLSQTTDQEVDSTFIPVLGLAIKGGTKDASRS